MFHIPDHWKSKRQIIVETYIRTGSMPATAEAIYGHRDVSYVRATIIQWKKLNREHEIVQYKRQPLGQEQAA